MSVDQEKIESLVNNLISKEKYSFIDMILRNIPVDRQKESVLNAYIQVTEQIKEKIPYREEFINRVKTSLEDRGLSS
jgi:hypothetical protein